MNIESRYTLHAHFRKKMRKEHYDLRIVRPDKKKAWSFALPKADIPVQGKKLLAIRTPDHDLKVMDFEGRLKETGDTIKILEQGKCDIVKNRLSHISILFHGKALDGLYAFVNIGKDNWLMIARK